MVLERDTTGDDDEVPVWTSCRHVLCARSGAAEPVLHVHVVHGRGGIVVELWTYYPDSRTSHLPIAALRGYHHDDWEGMFVAFRPDGVAARRARLGAQRLQRRAPLVGSGRRRLGALRGRRLPRERLARARLQAHATSISPATPGTAISPTVEPGVVPARRGRPRRAARPRLRPRGRAALGQGRLAQPRHAPHERGRRGPEPHGRGGAHVGAGVRAGRLVNGRPARTDGASGARRSG